MGKAKTEAAPLTRYERYKMNHPEKFGEKAMAALREKTGETPAVKIEPVKIEPPKPAATDRSKTIDKKVRPTTRKLIIDANAATDTRGSLEQIYAELQKEFGEEEVIVPALAAAGAYPKVKRIPMSSPKIMDLTGGGLPQSRSVEIFGDESCGKTSLACYMGGQVQAWGGIAAYVDVEQALDLEYAKTFNLDVDRMLFFQPSSGEAALNIVASLVEKKVDVVIVDSVAMLTPQAEIDGEIGDAHMALQARMMAQALRKITAAQAKSSTCIIWINQNTVAIGQWAPHGQIPVTQKGGKALRFAATIRIEIKKKEVEIDPVTEEAISQLMRLKTVKNKVAPPMRVREIRIRFGRGIEMDRDWFDYAVTFGVIVRRGGGHLFPSGHKETSGEKAWNYFKGLSVEEKEMIIRETRLALESASVTPTVITEETVMEGKNLTTRVSDEDEAEEEAGDAAD